MSQTHAPADGHHDAHALTHTSTGIENKKVAMWAFLGSDCMFFGTLISTHLIYRKIYPNVVDPVEIFDIELTGFSSFILLMSSFLMALAVSAAHKKNVRSMRNFLAGTVFFGLIFLGGQVYEFIHFVHGKGTYEWVATAADGREYSGALATRDAFIGYADAGESRAKFEGKHPDWTIDKFEQVRKVDSLTLSSSVFGSTFYLMTGTHGVHVALGVLWLFSWYVISFTKRYKHENALDIEVAGLYWHFVDVVWILIFTAVYLFEYI